MLMKLTFLILLSRFPNKISSSLACIPNSQIILNGQLCYCDSEGRWSDVACYSAGRRQACSPGQVFFEGCNRCVCQENGQLSCTEESCPSSQIEPVHESLASVLPWCNPFRTYYITCNICVCPASGKTIDARCALDISCTFFKEPSISDISKRKDTCIPKVMYLFPCLHCLCNDDGYFILDKCVETCVKKRAEAPRRCIPKTLYRKGCNVCLCPESSIPDDKLCTNNTVCEYPTAFKFLRTITGKPVKCKAHEFLKPRCVYCDCNHDGGIDEKTCLELECLKSDDLKYDTVRESCSPGEMVPFCMECLCTRNGITSDDFCSKACSYQSKIKVLEKIIAMPKNDYIINKEEIMKNSGNEVCKPDSIYIEQGRFCLCPDTGNTNFNLCTGIDKNLISKTNNTGELHIAIDFNVTCEPSTFVEFDCNTCFCSKKGRIDPKWCTYDDCEAKRLIQESHAIHPIISTTDTQLSDTCNPGSISNVDCNFCICPDSGFTEDRVCTKNDCSAFAKPPMNDKFSCEPLAYYEVDCNTCYCPRDGVKNVAKCTKNHCEKNYLRSDVCVPGQLFSDECNVCVCPPNGNKAEKACTNYTCTDTAPWKKIFQLSESLLGNQITEDATRNLDLCFPGEEFVIGCKLCVCPDMGLRIYATCSPTFCEEERTGDRNPQSDIGEGGRDNNGETNRDTEKDAETVMFRKIDTRRETCTTINYTNTFSRQKCTPGSMYIIRCKECICPYMGDINYFCRPLPEDFYCEQAFPNYNYLPMGRRTTDQNVTKEDIDALTLKVGNMTYVGNSTASSQFVIKPMKVLHEHTRYECDKAGKVIDECFMCECDGSSLIAEHCFRNDSKHCEDASPTFLHDFAKLPEDKT